MRKVLWMVGLALAVTVVAAAQELPRVEVFGGYSYLRVRGQADESVLLTGAAGSKAAAFTFPSFGLNGWAGSVAVNATRWFGVTADVGGLYGMPTMTVYGMPVAIAMREYNYLAGPRFTYRHGRWAPFAHASFGKAHASVLIGGPEIVKPISVVETKFAMAFGAGVDVTVYRRLAVRLAQADWLTTRFFASHQKDIQITTGLVIRL